MFSIKFPFLIVLFLFLIRAPDSALAQQEHEDSLPESELRELLIDVCSSERSVQSDALEKLSEIADIRTLPALTALRLSSLYAWANSKEAPVAVIAGDSVEDESAEFYEYPIFDALTEKPYLGEEGEQWWVAEQDLTKAKSTNRIRRKIRPLLSRLSLLSPNPEARRLAATKLGNAQKIESLPILEDAFLAEKELWTRHAIEEAIWIIQLENEDKYIRRAAANELGRLHASNGLVFMESMMEPDEEGNIPEQSEIVRAALENSISGILGYQQAVGILQTGFYGISLGAVLMMVALGLAITFGLMGVINMAHGELMMAGAYTTYVVQNIFIAYLPESVRDTYFILALPMAFLVAGTIGLLLEAGVIRFLYGRPLETLLLTWGISLIMQQGARHIFGAANVDVVAPSWLSGGFQIMVGLTLPYNRLFIILFSFLSLFGVFLLLTRTPLGLRIRAVTQNREMSASLGIPTRRVDAWTFALGAGLAGVAGCELSILGNVGPDLGQTYIVDSFMVVVLGGVGTLAGTVYSAFGIGMLSKLIEPFADAVLGKIFVLAFIILILQNRPGGLFPARGRGLED